jgi:hypothetical protein
MHAELLQDGLGIGQHIHQMRNGRALVTGHITDTAFQQGLGDRQNAFAMKHRAGLGQKLLYFFGE